MKESKSESEVLKIQDSELELELSCTDSTALVVSRGVLSAVLKLY
jgi:hypothetical protein